MYSYIYIYIVYKKKDIIYYNTNTSPLILLFYILGGSLKVS